MDKIKLKDIILKLLNDKKIYVSFIFIIALISISWFRGKNLISGMDLEFPLDRLDFFKLGFSGWDSRSIGGNNFRMFANIFPLGLFLALSELIGLSVIAAEKIWFFILFFSSGISMFYLSQYLIKIIQGKNNYVISFFSALVFMFNPFFGILISAFPFLWLTFAFIPLKLYFYIKILIEKKSLKYIFFICIFWIFVSASEYVNPKYLILDFIPIFLFFVYYLVIIVKNKQDMLRAIKQSLIIFFTIIILSSFWLLPAIINIKEEINTINNSYSVGTGRSRIISYNQNSTTSFFDSVRTLGLWSLNQGYKGEKYYYWVDIYNSPLFICLGFFIPIIIFETLFFIEKNKHFKNKQTFYYFILLMIFSVIGMNGTSNIFKYIIRLLTNNTPLFYDLFTTPYQIFGIYLTMAYAFLFPFCIFFTVNYFFKNRNKISLFIYIFLIILYIPIYSYPILSGDIIYPQGKIIPSNLYSIPDYYYSTSNFLKNQKIDFTIFQFPYSKMGYGTYDWKLGYSGVDISPQLFGKVISGVNSVPLSIAAKFSSTNDLVGLSLLNTKYLLYHGDYQKEFLKDHPWWVTINQQDFNEIILNQNRLNLSNQFGNLYLYKISSEYYLPHFYTPQTLITTSQSIETLPEIVSQPDYKIRSVIYFNNPNQISAVTNSLATSSAIFYPQELKKETISNTPVIEFKKINPTKYRVIIHHAMDNFPLVFSESFHDGWKTYLVADKKSALNFNPADYKILDGNGDDQASLAELKSYLAGGYISALGNGQEKNIKHLKWVDNKEVFAYNEQYKIDFISKSFQDTIQNDNLAPGSFYETWFKKPVADNQNHLMVNGYANSWNINPTELCGAPVGKALCVRNADGSYDLELVVEFWPQRLFYIGLFISGATLFGCLGYLGWDLVRRRKEKKGKGDVEGNG